MLSVTEYEHFDAFDLALAIKARELDPSEVLNTAIEVYQNKNPPLNAVIADTFEQAACQYSTRFANRLTLWRSFFTPKTSAPLVREYRQPLVAPFLVL